MLPFNRQNPLLNRIYYGKELGVIQAQLGPTSQVDNNLSPLPFDPTGIGHHGDEAPGNTTPSGGPAKIYPRMEAGSPG